MFDFRETVNEAESAHASPSFRRFASRARLGVAVIGAALVMLSAVCLGEHFAMRAILENERLIANDLAASVDSVLSGARARSRANVEALAGLPCGEIERKLAELETHLL
jgi:hypothetical protein